jgi:hypothetical protein
MTVQPFALGVVIVRPQAAAAMEAAKVTVWELLERHSAGDWAKVRAGDVASNARALEGAGPILSAHTLSTGDRVLVITEADHTSTTAVLSRELQEDRRRGFDAWSQFTARPR